VGSTFDTVPTSVSGERGNCKGGGERGLQFRGGTQSRLANGEKERLLKKEGETGGGGRIQWVEEHERGGLH